MSITQLSTVSTLTLKTRSTYLQQLFDQRFVHTRRSGRNVPFGYAIPKHAGGRVHTRGFYCFDLTGWLKSPRRQCDHGSHCTDGNIDVHPRNHLSGILFVTMSWLSHLYSLNSYCCGPLWCEQKSQSRCKIFIEHNVNILNGFF